MGSAHLNPSILSASFPYIYSLQLDISGFIVHVRASQKFLDVAFSVVSLLHQEALSPYFPLILIILLGRFHREQHTRLPYC